MKAVSCLLLFLVSAGATRADEKLKGIACRSVHLSYPAPEATAFYNEITVEKSAPGTYFMVCGWGHGYFGMQELADGKKVVLFSVWDPGTQNDPTKVNEDLRVKTLYKDESVRQGRFGNEGTGGQSFFDYAWKNGETYRFLVTAKADGKRTEYTGWFFVPEKKDWKKLITFSTLTNGKLLMGDYSFVEDFRRNKVSTTLTRKAVFGNGWILTAKNEWQELLKARFTGDSNPVLNIDAGSADGKFYLMTGGEITNKGTPLKGTMEREKGKLPNLPAELTPVKGK